jgi:hypothetical protein
MFIEMPGGAFLWVVGQIEDIQTHQSISHCISMTVEHTRASTKRI